MKKVNTPEYKLNAECLLCSRCYIKGGKCTGKNTAIPCLGYTTEFLYKHCVNNRDIYKTNNV